MNKFFRKADCPDTSVICSTLGNSSNKWDRQDKNKGVIYYQLAASSSEAPVHFNHVAENKAGTGQGISKAWYLRRRFVNPEDSAEVQTMRTELGKLPAGVFKNGITADRILEALKGSRSTSAPARPLLLLPRPPLVTPQPRIRQHEADQIADVEQNAHDERVLCAERLDDRRGKKQGGERVH